MATHTPGPWSAQNYDVTGDRPLGDSGVRFWGIVAGGEYRGDVCSVHCAEHIGGITIAERDANARLIAAAPELLDALLCARVIVDGAPVTLGRSLALQKIDGAIAKARGEA